MNIDERTTPLPDDDGYGYGGSSGFGDGSGDGSGFGCASMLCSMLARVSSIIPDGEGLTNGGR